MDAINLYNEDNISVDLDVKAELVYADCIYESVNLTWIVKYWHRLIEGGVFIVQTDWHTVSPIWEFMNVLSQSHFINHLVWKNEWGNHPKDRFHQCFDDILIFSKGKKYNFYPERIQVPKATANTKLNPSGRQTKTATAWIDDICLTTTSKERVKKADGHLIRWQKPLKLFDRIIAPFTNEFGVVIDPFMGSGSLAEWCAINKRFYFGMENDKEVYDLAVKRLDKYR